MSGTLDTSARKLRIAFLIDRWDPQRGGAERAMVQLAEHLIARGHHVLAVALEHAPGSPGEHVRVKAFGFTRSSRERKLARALVATAREHGADVTIGVRHLYECDLYWPHGGAHRVTLDALVRAGIESAGVPARGRHAAFLEFERELLERGGARKIACVSQLVFDELAREYPACRERLALVENGVDLQKFHPGLRVTVGATLRAELGISPRTALIAFAARNPWLKGFKELLGVLGTLHMDVQGGLPSRDLDWHVLVAGSSELTRYPTSPFEQLRGRVTIREHVAPEVLWSAADLCVLPTWRDTSGLVILESLACGTPVITTKSAGAHDVISAEAGAVIAGCENGTEWRSRTEFSLALREAIVEWLAHIARGDIDRAAIRACVAHRDSATWLAKLEALVVELAASKKSS